LLKWDKTDNLFFSLIRISYCKIFDRN